MFQLLFYLFFWYQLYTHNYYKFNDHKLTMNKVSLFHAIICTFFFLAFTITDNYSFHHDIYYTSTSYFLFDTYHHIFKSKKNTSTWALIAHHLVAIYSLHWIFYAPWCHGLIDIIGFAELSNIPGYFTYYFKKIYKNDNKNKWIINYFIVVQTIIYSFIRILVLPSRLYIHDITKFPIQFYILGVLLYIMGFIWSIKLINQTKQLS